MANKIDFKFFGWYNKGTSDKIWGWFQIEEKVYNFWGARGANKLIRIKFKQFAKETSEAANLYEVRKIQREKTNKGYVPQDLTLVGDEMPAIEAIYPGFNAHCHKEMFVAKLSGTIMGVE